MRRKTDDDIPVLVIFRNDLRIADNRALAAAAETGRPVVTAFIFDQESDGTRLLGGARRWWLHHSLAVLSSGLEAIGGKLIIRRGLMVSVVDEVLKECDADTVFWNRRYAPSDMMADAELKQGLKDRGISAESFDGQLLHEPSRLKTKAGGYYKVYTPFWNAFCETPEPRDPVDAPKKIRQSKTNPRSLTLDELELLPTHPDWAGGLRERWQPGEAGAHQLLSDFLDSELDDYERDRDFPGKSVTSGLSPHLANGEITPFQIFAALKRSKRKSGQSDVEKFRKELLWREFCYHLLFHNRELDSKNFQPGFNDFPWRKDKQRKRAWQRGQTGYPIVDAGMRELWQTGVMHNRVRMIAASFLIKHLLVDWRDGEKWFWDTLVDADPASNPGNWQWVAGTGADAAPYFRIFNPVAQGEKFDRAGDYVRRFVPEIAGLPDKFLHRPWDAPAATLRAANVKLGKTYPVPIVEHALARDRALAAYKSMRGHE